MRILVTGGNGQVGRAFAAISAESDYSEWNVRVVSREDLDITDPQSIGSNIADFQPDLLVNPAAFTSVDEAEKDPTNAFRVNFEGVKCLAGACAEKGIQVIHFSTDFVFDGKLAGTYSPNHKAAPSNQYGISKLRGERALRAMWEQSLVIRASWIFGMGNKNFVAAIISRAKAGKKLAVVDNEFGGPTSADSLARATCELIKRYSVSKELETGTLHFCQRPYLSRYQFAVEIIERAYQLGVLDSRVEVTPVSSVSGPYCVSRPKNSRLEVSKPFQALDDDLLYWTRDLDRIILKLK